MYTSGAPAACVTMWCWVCSRAFSSLVPWLSPDVFCSKTQKPTLDCPFSCLAADHVLQALCRFDPRHRSPGQRPEDLPAVKHLVVADG